MPCLYDLPKRELTPLQELFCNLGAAVLFVPAVVGFLIVKISGWVWGRNEKLPIIRRRC